MLDIIEKNLLREVADLDSLPAGAYNIRLNGASDSRRSTAHIEIVTKTDKPGIDINIKDHTVNESVHIPVILSQTGLKETVYNDFHIGEGCDVTIVAGCGIHNCGGGDSRHDGVHTFHVGRNSRVRYVEKHFGQGDGAGRRVMNPETVVILEEGAFMEMEATQIGGVDDTIRSTTATLAAGSKLEIHEKVMTDGEQKAVSNFTANMDGEDCSCNIVSRTVAKGRSRQHFTSVLNGRAKCAGHTECDSIIMDEAVVMASPQLLASSQDANLIHEAAIGKIAGEQLIKLMTLGLSEKEAEEQVIAGFLR